MGLRDVLRQAKAAMNPAAIKQGLEAARHPPSQEEIDASLESLTPEQRAAYDANMAKVEAGHQQSLDAEAEIRVLDGPAGDVLYGRSVEDVDALFATGGLSAVLGASKQMLIQDAKGIYGGDLAPHEKDRELAGRIGAEELAERMAARVPYLAPGGAPAVLSRVTTRGATQLDEVIAFLRSSGLGGRPDLVFGVYRLPDRVSPMATPESESGRVVEWDVVHAGLPGQPSGSPVHAAFFGAREQWVARRAGEPSVLDEDLGLEYLARAGAGPEWCLGIARFCTFVRPEDRWFAITGGTEEGGPRHSYVPLVEGVVVLHPNSDSRGVQAQMAAEAPIRIGTNGFAGTHVEVLNWAEVARAVHPRLQHPPAAPSPFPYLPSTPQELLLAYLGIVGVRAHDSYSAQVTIDEARHLAGRTAMGESTIGSEQPCADGKDRRRLHGARRVVVVYRDSPEYVEGRGRWNAYQREVLHSHLGRATHVRRPVVVDEAPRNALLRAGAKVLDVSDRVAHFGHWEPPPRHRYCWPPVD